ncbi:MAG: hypothetical protein IPL65_12590 [Lewinellaceae bacterium]|nr:hypothetical protein [Lewinellaceae bacterium]
MNQIFLTKLRNALGIVALLGAMLSAESASAQSFLPNAQAVQVVIATMNNLQGQATAQVAAPASPLDKGNFDNKVTANSVQGALFSQYLNLLVVQLKQGVPTGTAINNVYDTIANTPGASTGTRMATLDAVKQQVITLLSN